MELIRYSIIKADCEPVKGCRNYLLFYQIEGDSFLIDEGKKKAFSKGQIRVFNPGDEFSFECRNGICAVLEISYSKVLKLMGYQRKIIVCDTDREANESSIDLARKIEELIRAYYDSSSNRSIVYEQNCLQLVFQLITSYSNNVFGSTIDERKNRIEDYIEAHYADELSLETIADEFGLTVPYFSKYFKENFAMTFLSYLNKKRLDYAREDLLESDESALRIAINNGFPNSASFIREFRKEYGMTPAQYRQENLKKETEKETEDILIHLEDTSQEKAGSLIEIGIDSKDSGVLLEPYWTDILNLSSFRSVMKNGMMEQISNIQSRLHFRCARLLLDTYSPDGKHLFYITDRVMELFVRSHMDVIAVIDMRDVSDQDGFLFFLKEQCQRIVNRFGEGISRHITFELMYNSSFSDQKLRDYARFYRSLSNVTAESRIESKIIGPSVLMDHDGENFRRFVKALPQIDTYTISIAPFSIYQKNGEVFINRLTDSAYGEEQFLTAKKILEEENRDSRLLITEWKDSLNEIDALNETSYMGARILRNILSGYGTFNSMPLATPLDLIFDEMKYDKIFNLLPGIITARGIEKPSFHALRFLDRQDKYLIARTSDYLISRSTDEGFYQIVCHNCKKLGYRYFLKENYEDISQYEEIFEDNEEKVFRFIFHDLPKGKYLLKTRTVSDDSGCAYMNYHDLKYGDESFVGESEISYLKAMSVPKMEGETYRVDQGDLIIERRLKSNEFCHLHLLRVLD